jgi:hypothetical protein
VVCGKTGPSFSVAVSFSVSAVLHLSLGGGAAAGGDRGVREVVNVSIETRGVEVVAVYPRGGVLCRRGEVGGGDDVASWGVLGVGRWRGVALSL